MGDIIAFLVLVVILGVFIGWPIYLYSMAYSRIKQEENSKRHGHTKSYCQGRNSICKCLQPRYENMSLSTTKKLFYCCKNSECCLFDKLGSIENVKKYVEEQEKQHEEYLKEQEKQKVEEFNKRLKKLHEEEKQRMLKYDKEYRHGNTLAYCEKHKYECECLRYKKGRDTSYCKCDRCIIKEQESYQEYLKATKK